MFFSGASLWLLVFSGLVVLVMSVLPTVVLELCGKGALVVLIPRAVVLEVGILEV